MKRYLFLVLILFFAVQVFAQKESLKERYRMPEGEVFKFYHQTENSQYYFFNPIGFDNTCLAYFKYLALQESRIISIENNKTTTLLTIQISHDLEIEEFKNQILLIKEEIDELVATNTEYRIEIEKILSEATN